MIWRNDIGLWQGKGGGLCKYVSKAGNSIQGRKVGKGGEANLGIGWA